MQEISFLSAHCSLLLSIVKIYYSTALAPCFYCLLFEQEVYGNWPEGFHGLAICISNQCQDSTKSMRALCAKSCFYRLEQRLTKKRDKAKLEPLFLCIVNISCGQRWQHHTNEGPAESKINLTEESGGGGRTVRLRFDVVFFKLNSKDISCAVVTRRRGLCFLIPDIASLALCAPATILGNLTWPRRTHTHTHTHKTKNARRNTKCRQPGATLACPMRGRGERRN